MSSEDYDIGEHFLMTLPLTPELQETYGKKSLIVDAVYKGVIEHNDALKRREAGSLNILALSSGSATHHVVEFADELWVNDLILTKGRITKWEETTINLESNEAEFSSPNPKESKMECEYTDEVANSAVPREKVRQILAGTNEWNIKGLKDSRRDTDGDIKVCEVTGEELYFVRDDNVKITLRTHATCYDCRKLVGGRAIQRNGSDKAKWPVHYIGVYCTECWPNKK